MEWTFSICLPTYNRAQLLPGVFDCLRRQSYRRFELIVVDDGSTDATEMVVGREAALSAFRTKLIRHEKNLGRTRALNSALKEIRGELALFLDDDVRLLPDSLRIAADTWSGIPDEDKRDFWGIVGLCQTGQGETIGDKFGGSLIDGDYFELREIDRVRGDKKEIFCSELAAGFEFDLFEGERQTSTSELWYSLSQKRKVRCLDTVLAENRYLPDGMSAQSLRLRVDSAHSSRRYYARMLAMFPDMPTPTQIRFVANWARFAAHSKSAGETKTIVEICRVLPSVAAAFLGLSRYLFDVLVLSQKQNR